MFNNLGDFDLGNCDIGDFDLGDFGIGDYDLGDFNLGDFDLTPSTTPSYCKYLIVGRPSHSLVAVQIFDRSSSQKN